MNGWLINAQLYWKGAQQILAFTSGSSTKFATQTHPLKYGIKVAQPKDTTPLLLDAQCKHAQEIVGTLLY